MLASLHMEDGSTLFDGLAIANACTQYSGKILSKHHQPSHIKSVVTDLLLSFVSPTILTANASRLKVPFEKSKLLYAL